MACSRPMGQVARSPANVSAAPAWRAGRSRFQNRGQLVAELNSLSLGAGVVHDGERPGPRRGDVLLSVDAIAALLRASPAHINTVRRTSHRLLWDRCTRVGNTRRVRGCAFRRATGGCFRDAVAGCYMCSLRFCRIGHVAGRCTICSRGGVVSDLVGRTRLASSRESSGTSGRGRRPRARNSNRRYGARTRNWLSRRADRPPRNIFGSGSVDPWPCAVRSTATGATSW